MTDRRKPVSEKLIKRRVGVKPIRILQRRPPIKAMAIPRMSDVFRAEPNLLGQAAAFTVDAFKNAVGVLNRDRGAAGQRPIDMPGRRAPRRIMRRPVVKIARPRGGGMSRYQ